MLRCTVLHRYVCNTMQLGGNPTAIRPSGHMAAFEKIYCTWPHGRFFFFKKAAISLKSGHGRMAGMPAMAGWPAISGWPAMAGWPFKVTQRPCGPWPPITHNTRNFTSQGSCIYNSHPEQFKPLVREAVAMIKL